MSKNLGELVVSVVFLVLLAVKLDPFGWTMPDPAQMLVLALVIATFAVYAGVLFRERPEDEREAVHIHRASRVGYLAGVALLVAAITAKSLSQESEPWLFVVLAGMILSKLAARIWMRNRN